MAEQDSPWEGLPPPPPGVPDQAPKPPPGPATAPDPQPDPWARPEGWRLPDPSRRRPGSSPGPGGFARWIVVAVAGFLLFGSCLGMLPSVVPDFDPPAGFPYGPSEAPTSEPAGIRQVRLVATERTPELPAGWTWYAASDGSFVTAGPRRLDRTARADAVTFVFRAQEPLGDLGLRVVEVGRPSGGRRFLSRITAEYLEDLGVTRFTTTFDRAGSIVELRAEWPYARTDATLRTFVREGRLYRAWGGVPRDASPDVRAALETFLRSVTAAPAG